MPKPRSLSAAGARSRGPDGPGCDSDADRPAILQTGAGELLARPASRRLLAPLGLVANGPALLAQRLLQLPAQDLEPGERGLQGKQRLIPGAAGRHQEIGR